MKYNVLQLIGSLHQGGSESQALQLTRLMAGGDRFRTHLAALSPEGSLRARAEAIGFSEIPSFPLTSFYDRNAIVQTKRFVNYLRDNSIHVVQTHDFYTNVFGMFGAAVARVPVRVAARRETSGLRSAMQKRAEKLSYRLSHAIVANADAVKQKLIEEGISERKIITIHNGLDLNRIRVSPGFSRDGSLQHLSLPINGRRFVTIVANLRHEVKDHPTFLSAAQIVKDAVADSAFVLVGEGELVDSMKRIASELGISEDVFFVGRCDRIADVLSVSDVCVLSSAAEGFPNAILEYMAAGRAVVATDVGGTREAVRDGETGFVVPPKDPKVMAERIIALLNNQVLAHEMGAYGKRVVEEDFSCAAQLKKTEGLYERLLSTQTRSVNRFSKVRYGEFD